MYTQIQSIVANTQSTIETKVEKTSEDTSGVSFEEILQCESDGKQKKEKDTDLNSFLNFMTAIHSVMNENIENITEQVAESINPISLDADVQSVQAGIIADNALPITDELVPVEKFEIPDEIILVADDHEEISQIEMTKDTIQAPEKHLDKEQNMKNMQTSIQQAMQEETTLKPAVTSKVNTIEKDNNQTKFDIQTEDKSFIHHIDDVEIKVEVKSESDNQTEEDTAQSTDDKMHIKEMPKLNQAIEVFEFQKVQDKRIDFVDNTQKLMEAVENKIVKSVNFAEMDGRQEFELQLKPEFLGKLNIKLVKDESGMKVKVFTSNLQVKEMLSVNIQMLHHQIQDKGIELSNVEVIYNDFLGDANMNQREGNAQSNQRKSVNAKDEYDNSIAFAEDLGIATDINLNGSVSYLA